MDILLMTTSVYSPLDCSAQEIRVLRLETSLNSQQQVQCTLSTHSLNCSKLSFVALSHVWGTDGGRETIYVNGFPVQITCDLHKLLCAMKNPAVAPLQLQHLWIDALCINQADKSEQASQIQLMRRIYREARFVVAWLGEPSNDSWLAFRVLKIAAGERAAKTKFNSTSWLRKHKDLLCTFEETSLSVSSDTPNQQSDGKGDNVPPYNSAWRSIFNLVRRPYFRRLWTFQEIVLPCTLYLICGSEVSPLEDILWIFIWVISCDIYSCPTFMEEVVWEILSDASYVRATLGFNSLARIYNARKNCHGSCNIQNIAACRCQRSSLYLIGKSEEEDLESSNRQSLSLWDIASITLPLLATDPRDKVYGILGLGEWTIIPDYAKPVREVFIEFASIGVQEDLNRVMGLSRWIDREAQPDNSDPELPSWVPPLSTRGGRFTVPGRSEDFHASELRYMDGKTWPRNWMRPWVESETLHVQGLLCDQVSSVSDLIMRGNIFGLVSQYVQEHMSDVSYITRIPRFQAMLRVLIQDADLENDGRLIPGSGALQRHAWAFLSWLLLEQEENEIDKEQFLNKLGLHGLLDDGYRDVVFQTRILGDANDGEYVAESFSIDEALDPGQALWIPMERRMDNNEKHRLFQTEGGYLGIGPRTMRPGDAISVLFGCSAPVVLRATGSYHHHLGPCFILGFMEGEAIREMVNGSKSVTEFQIH